MQLTMNIGKQIKQQQDMAEIGLEDVSLLDALSQFDPYGAWRLDISTGLAYWTKDVYRIHGMSQQAGPVDLVTAINAYHPDDRGLVMQCFEEAIAKKSGFRFVLRLISKQNAQILVKSTGMFRTTERGDELFGTFSIFQPAIRAIAVI